MKQYKKGFALIFTIILVISFSIYSLTIIETDTISSNINKLKYLHLQANIYITHIKDLIKSNGVINIEDLNLHDNRYELNVTKVLDGNRTNYYISINTKDETPVRLSELIVK